MSRASKFESRGTQFTCFTSTKVQILTPEELLEGLLTLSRQGEKDCQAELEAIKELMQVEKLKAVYVCWRMLTYAHVF